MIYAQVPGRQQTRRVDAQGQPQTQQSEQQGQLQIQIGNRRPQRQVEARGERGLPTVDPTTGQYQPRRQIYIRPPRIAPLRIARQWRLGIQVDNAPLGLRISGVADRSPAWRFGIEEGDYLLDIMGYPVGFYEGAYYPLAETLNQTIQRDGWVNILVWNQRTNAAEAMWVQAEPRRGFEPRETSN
jgi:hypothetical protein